MNHRRLTARSSRLVPLMLACFSMLLLQACSEPLSIVNEIWRSQDDHQIEAPVEAELVVSEDGQVRASGGVQDVSTATLTVADASFRVTKRTTLTDANDRDMSLSDFAVGTFVEVEGIVVDDGSFEAVSARSDSTVMLCHIPPGNPDRARTVSVGGRASEAHLAHGDYEGECEEASTSDDPDDEQDVESDDPESSDPDEEKVAVCHVPPGNPDNAHTINIGISDLQDHLDHGDSEGDCLE